MVCIRLNRLVHSSLLSSLVHDSLMMSVMLLIRIFFHRSSSKCVSITTFVPPQQLGLASCQSGDNPLQTFIPLLSDHKFQEFRHFSSLKSSASCRMPLKNVPSCPVWKYCAIKHFQRVLAQVQPWKDLRKVSLSSAALSQILKSLLSFWIFSMAGILVALPSSASQLDFAWEW